MNPRGWDMSKEYLIITFSVAILSLVLSMPVASGSRDYLLVRYIPFDVETYAAVTPSNIIESTTCVYGGVPEEVLQSVRKLIDRAVEGRFDDTRVRVKFEGLEGGNVYIDADGGLLIEPALAIRQMSESDFSALKDLFLVIGRRNCHFGPRQWPKAAENSNQRKKGTSP